MRTTPAPQEALSFFVCITLNVGRATMKGKRLESDQINFILNMNSGAKTM
jgi:hypothetical protein